MKIQEMIDTKYLKKEIYHFVNAKLSALRWLKLINEHQEVSYIALLKSDRRNAYDPTRCLRKTALFQGFSTY